MKNSPELQREGIGTDQSLEPGEADARRLVSVDRVRTLLSSSSNPRFVQQGQTFIETIEPDDVVVEFCTSEKSWREGQGSSGFLIEREGNTVAKLIVRLN